MSTTLTPLKPFETTSLPKDVLSPADRQTVFAQIRHFRQKLPREILEKHEKPLSWLSMRQLIMDWGVALASWQLYLHISNVFTFVLALFCMAYSQRGISNLTHDCSHFNLFSSKRWNYFVGDFLMCPSLMATMRSQREAHVAHHNYLGSEQDPDHGLGNKTSLKHYRNENFTHKSIWALFLYDVLDAKLFLQHAAGSLNDHALHIVRPTVGIPLPIAWRFCAMWHLSRCTIMYGVYIFREILDHSGLPSDTILSFTRTSPYGTALQKFLQPHDDNFHLLHHLLPKVPMGHLYSLHSYLVKHVPEYERANRYEVYFGGEHGLLTQELHREMVL
ncbi:fatty acid desaturase-domain-containing protein [Mycena albidolilacea]|uniref:Fatty acid desaturase-domain-containing protein n=1 Tax=Mycena albidolilacea TaxID=1033008 RepID=A0AAD7ENZ9_9AGAR|nr:fatty acid desaturase-domain-containing protein [Mycena albidolilacea]